MATERCTRGAVRITCCSRVRGSSACTATSAMKLSITTATDAHMRNAMSTV